MSIFRVAKRIANCILENNFPDIRRILDPLPQEEIEDIMCVTVNRSSLLFLAIIQDNLEITTHFLQKCSADANSIGFLDGKRMTCLYLAVEFDIEDIVRMLLEHGANVHTNDMFQGTALFRACQYIDMTLACILIEYGSDVNGRDYTGENCLMEAMCNYELFQYLIQHGADVNWSCFAQSTVLINALLEGENSIIYHLLTCCDINVRVRNETEEDAFSIAVRCSPDDIVVAIRDSGRYTELEILRIYELECAFFRIRRNEHEAKELWSKIVRIRGLPLRTPLFHNQNPTGEMVKTRDFLQSDDCSALSYIETFYKSDVKFLLQAFVHSTLNIKNKVKMSVAMKFLVKMMESLSDDDFFQASIQPKSIIERHFDDCNSRTQQEIYRTYISFVLDYIQRFKKKNDAEKDEHAYQVECFFYDVLGVLHMMYQTFPENIEKLDSDITALIAADLCGLYGKSIIQVAVRVYSPVLLIKALLRCGSDMYRKDKTGRTLIHDIIEYRHKNKLELIQFLLNEGLNLDYIFNYDYCIPCYIKTNKIMPNPDRFLTLQCRIVNKILDCDITEVPACLEEAVNLHVHLPPC